MQASHPYPALPTRVIRVSGSDRDIGRQHAEQVGKDIEKGMPAFYYRFWKMALNGELNPSSDALSRSARKMGSYLLDPLLVNQLLKGVPEFARERIQGMCDVGGHSYRQFVTALVLPDLLPLLQAYAGKFGVAKFIEAMPPRFGCTSFVAQGASFLHGRNLDFPGVSYWDRYPIIQVTERTGYLRYIGFTTAGVPICGITGVNEAQISVSLHQHYCRVTSLRGQLPFITGEEILSRARTLEEAKAIIEQAEISSSWAFVVCDGKTKEAFICETHPKAKDFRWLRQSGTLAHSNYFQTSGCKPSEYATTARMNWDNYWRKTRLESIVRKAGGKLTAKDATKLVSDHFDPYWGEEKTINRTVSQVYNIQSLSFDLENMRVWMAEGDSPVQLRQYHEYDLGALLAGKEGKTGETTSGYLFESEKNRAAKEAYILSFISAFDGKYPEADERIRRSLDAAFWPEAALVSAVVKLKLNDFPRALELLQQAKSWIEDKKENLRIPHFPPEYFEVCLYLGRCYDLLGRREEARKEYELLASRSDLEDANIRFKAEQGKPYRAKQIEKILMPYSSYIPFD